jgi:aminoglycoside phosphotransferase (APT) family kinase protein
VWVHRDLPAGNLVGVNSRLSGVLDVGGLAVSNPADNVMAAFQVFSSPDSRSLFNAAVGAEDATWSRARGWALTQGLNALVYYLDSHPGRSPWPAGSSEPHSNPPRSSSADSLA